jgi:hypothetical protein
VQGGATADHEVAAVRVGGGQPAPQVGLQEQAAAAESPPPRLAVVHRRRVATELDGGADGSVVDRVDDHDRPPDGRWVFVHDCARWGRSAGIVRP